MKIKENLTNPGATPVNGDLIKITHPNGTIERKKFYLHLEIQEDRPAQMSVYAFKRLLGQQNRLTIRALAETDPIVFDLLDLVNSADIIDFADSKRGPKEGLDYLLSISAISENEHARILSREFSA